MGHAMVETAEQLALILSQYQETWLGYVSHVEAKLRMLQVLKQGVELLVLVGSYLIFYFIECFTEVLSMPLPLVP